MKKPILVTGAHRSGTTWLGKIISLSNRVRYIHEPFNVHTQRKFNPINHVFAYIHNQSDCKYRKQVEEYIQSFLTPVGYKDFLDIKNYQTPRSIMRIGKKYLNQFLEQPLLKDPIAIMSAEWIHQTYHADVVVTIRHPAAFVASLKVKNWQFDFNNLLKQQDLMDNILYEFENVIRFYVSHKQDIINQGILLWNIIYTVVLGYISKYADRWLFVKHEELSIAPLRGFEQIFKYLDLPFTEKVQCEIILSTTSVDNEQLRRNSKANIFAWKERLNNDEINRIKEGTLPLWKEFYCKEDWSQ